MQYEDVHQADRTIAEFGELTEDQVGNQVATPRILWKLEFSLNPAGHCRGSLVVSGKAGTRFVTNLGNNKSAARFLAVIFVLRCDRVRERFQDLRGSQVEKTGVHREFFRPVLFQGPQIPEAH